MKKKYTTPHFTDYAVTAACSLLKNSNAKDIGVTYEQYSKQNGTVEFDTKFDVEESESFMTDK